jgi:hypothetical protein
MSETAPTVICLPCVCYPCCITVCYNAHLAVTPVMCELITHRGSLLVTELLAALQISAAGRNELTQCVAAACKVMPQLHTQRKAAAAAAEAGGIRCFLVAPAHSRGDVALVAQYWAG